METVLLQPKSANNTAIKRHKKLCVMTIVVCVLLAVGLSVFLYFALKKEETAKTFDIEWFYDLMLSTEIDSTHLKHGYLHKLANLTEYEQGLYRGDFDRYYLYNGTNPDIIQSRNLLVTQSRFLYIFGLTFQKTKDIKFYHAMDYGLEVLLNEYYDPIYGGYYTEIQKYKNGTFIILDDIKSTYNMNFAMIAMTKCYEITLNDTILQRLTDLYWLLMNNFTDSSGITLINGRTRNLSQIAGSSNNQVHFLRALDKMYHSYQLQQDEVMMNEMKYRINKLYHYMMSTRSNTTFDGISYLLFSNSIPMNAEWSLFLRQIMEKGIIEMNDTNIWNIDNMLNFIVDIGYDTETKMLSKGRYWRPMETLRTVSYFYYRNEYSKYIKFDQNQLFNVMINTYNTYKGIYCDPDYGGVYYDPENHDFAKGKTTSDGSSTKAGYHLGCSCFDILEVAQFDGFNVTQSR